MTCPKGTLRVKVGPVIKFLVIPPNLKLALQKNYLLDAGWYTNLLGFQGAQPDHVQVKSSSCCFPRESVRFDS